MGAPNKQTLRICPQCQTRFVASYDNIDHVHDCNTAASDALRNEDVINLGPFTDFQDTGQESTGGRGSKFEVFYQGIGNRLFGTRAALEGEDFDGTTSRGNRTPTHRTRKSFAYKKLK